MSETFEGTLHIFRYRRLRNGNSVTTMLLDIVKPLPPWTLAVVKTDRQAGAHEWQLRFPERRKLDDLIPHEGHRIRVRCTPRHWNNGLGADALRAKWECLDVAEDVVSVLAASDG